MSYQCPECECYEVRALSDKTPLNKRGNRPLQPLRRSPPPLRDSHKPRDARPLRDRLQAAVTVDAKGDKAD